jgi:hypothetical protein
LVAWILKLEDVREFTISAGGNRQQDTEEKFTKRS